MHRESQKERNRKSLLLKIAKPNQHKGLKESLNKRSQAPVNRKPQATQSYKFKATKERTDHKEFSWNNKLHDTINTET